MNPVRNRTSKQFVILSGDRIFNGVNADKRRFKKKIKNICVHLCVSVVSLCFCSCLATNIYAAEHFSEPIIQDGHKKVIRSLSFSPDGNIIVSGGLDRTIRLWDAHDMSLLKTLSGHTGSINSIAISPDGRLLASGGDDKIVRLWDIEKRSSIGALSGHNGSVFSVAFSPDGRLLASGGDDKIVRLWDIEKRSSIAALSGHNGSVFSVVFSPGGDILISASGDAAIGIWDVHPVRSLDAKDGEITIQLNDSDNGTSNGVKKRTPQFLTGHSGAVHTVAFSPDGRLLASGGDDETIKLWDIKNMKIVETLSEHHERGFHPIYNLRFSPDGEILATAGAYPNVHLWDIKKKMIVKMLYDNSHAVYSVDFSPKKRIAVSGGWDTTIKLWDITTGTKTHTFENRIIQLYLQSFTRDGRVLTIGSRDKAIKIWDLRGELKNLFEKQDGLIESVALSDDNRMLAAGYRDNTVKIWDFENLSLQGLSREREPVAVFKGHENWPICIEFSPGRSVVASGGLDRTVRLWDIYKKAPIATLRGHNEPIKSLNFSPDGNTLISTGWGGEMIAWDINLQSPVDTFKGYNGITHLARFSPDGKYVAIITKENIIHLLSIDGRSIIPLTPPLEKGGMGGFSSKKETINSIAFSPDGHLLAIGDGANMVSLWRLSAFSFELSASFAGHSDSVYAVAFSADGKRLVSGSEDHSIKVWDVEKGIPLMTLLAIEKDDFLIHLHDNNYIASEGAKKYVKQYRTQMNAEKNDSR